MMLNMHRRDGRRAAGRDSPSVALAACGSSGEVKPARPRSPGATGRQADHRHLLRPARARAEGRRQPTPASTSTPRRTSPQALGVPKENITWNEANPADRENLLTSGQVDLVFSTYSITDDRKQLVDFAGPYFEAHQDLLVRRNEEEITGPETLNGRDLCSVTGTTSAAYVKEHYKGKIDAAGVPEVLRLRRGAGRQRGRRGDHRRRDPRRLRRRAEVQGQAAGDRQGLHRRAVRRRASRRATPTMVDKVNAALKQYIDDGVLEAGAEVRRSGRPATSIPDPPTPGTPDERWTCDRRSAGSMRRGRRSRRASWPAIAPFDALSPARSCRRPPRRRGSPGSPDRRADPGRVHRAPTTRCSSCRPAGWRSGTTPTGSPTPADEQLGPGGLFGFSAMLTERSVGPRAVAAGDGDRGRADPRARSCSPAFASPRGARSWPTQISRRRSASGRERPGYSLSTSSSSRPRWSSTPLDRAGRRARQMTERGVGYARRPARTAASGWSPTPLLRRVIAGRAVPPATPAGELMDPDPPTVGPRRLGRGGPDPDAGPRRRLPAGHRPGRRAPRRRQPPGLRRVRDHRRRLAARAAAPGRDRRRAARAGSPDAGAARRPARPGPGVRAR